MMLQKKSNSWARLKYAYVLPLAAIAVIAFARPEISQPFDEISSAKVSNLILKVDLPEVEKIFPETLPPADNATSIMGSDENVALPDTKPVNSNSSIVAQAADTTVVKIVDEMPEFPGGMQELIAYLMQNIKYPISALQKGISGRVTTQFIVEKDGSITNVEVNRSIDAELDAEALRVVRAMPKWKPGKVKGEIVRVSYTLPVMFRLSK